VSYESLHFSSMSLAENTGREQERISFTLFSKAAGILTKRTASAATTVSKAKENGARAANGLPIIARSKEHFRYQDGPGLLMLDHDKARATCELPGSVRQPLPRPSEKQHGFCLPKCIGFANQNTAILHVKIQPF
jgi:hypothetical protein